MEGVEKLYMKKYLGKLLTNLWPMTIMIPLKRHTTGDSHMKLTKGQQAALSYIHLTGHCKGLTNKMRRELEFGLHLIEYKLARINYYKVSEEGLKAIENSLTMQANRKALSMGFELDTDRVNTRSLFMYKRNDGARAHHDHKGHFYMALYGQPTEQVEI